ncbi:penicillin acylase family protein [Nocardioides aurantiacus]|uniref:penicillin acylase family protein n=1 Tax=Nocardioides aurantiacus TaxID=86796 RepID=UPI001FE961D8|nr:penicillin acylase family protein [Nocardioides aurantiacus]
MTSSRLLGRLDTFRGWPGWARATTYAVAALALLLVVVTVGAVVMVRRPLPETEGTLTVPGLGADVEVLRDARGVPQIYADDATDLFYAQGYVQAQDRFYDMDVRRHVTAGRLAELVGPAAVESDLTVRTLGWRRVAEREFDLLDPATRSYLESYSDGVNAWLRGRSVTAMSVEYTLLALGGLDYKPEQWTPVDSLAWLKAMAWDLRGNMADEVARTRLAVDRSPEQVDELYPRYPYGRHATVLPDATAAAPAPRATPAWATRSSGEQQDREGADAVAAVRDHLASVPALLGTGDGLGSNAWAVSGEHTVSGEPLLANDPHLGVSQPAVWYQTGLHCRSLGEDCPFDVSGFTFAGFPGVIVGHNRDIAWGMTNLDPDVTDLFLEKVEGKTYEYDGQQLPLVERDEEIRVEGEGTRLITVRSTRHGPLLSDVSRELSSVGANAEVGPDAPERGNGYGVALAWTALTPRPTADAVFALGRARDWDDFREAARDFAVPSQNLVYADREGNIGYQAPGDVPIRRSGRDGRYPAAGWDSRNDWTGRLVPFEQLPSRLNPAEGFVVSANQAATGPGYPFLLTTDWDHGYRSQRIRRLLEARIDAGAQLDVRAVQDIQTDTRNPMGPVLVPYLLRPLMTSEYYADGQRLLLDWDFDQAPDSAAAAYFEAVWRSLLRLTFHDELPASLWPDGGQRWVAVVSNLLRQPDSQWWDDSTTTGVIEDRDQILAEALEQARDELTRRLSVSPRQWSWGRLHRLELEHQTLGRGSAVARALLDRGPEPVGGGGTSVDATAWTAPAGYDVTTAPSMRMVVDLADLDASRWVLLGGASGHPASPHYTDQLGTWLAGRTLAWPFSREAVEQAAEDRLVLRPGG